MNDAKLRYSLAWILQSRASCSETERRDARKNFADNPCIQVRVKHVTAVVRNRVPFSHRWRRNDEKMKVLIDSRVDESHTPKLQRTWGQQENGKWEYSLWPVASACADLIDNGAGNISRPIAIRPIIREPAQSAFKATDIDVGALLQSPQLFAIVERAGADR